MNEIRHFRNLAHHGIWVLISFLVLSFAVLFTVNFPVPIPESLGPPPSASMVSGGLVLYFFSAIMMVLARMTAGKREYTGYGHIGYLLVFYFFYHLTQSLAENFWAVFATGITIISLEGYHIWNFSMEAIEDLKRDKPTQQEGQDL